MTDFSNTVELDDSVQSTQEVIDTKNRQFYYMVKDAKEAHTLCRTLIDENKDRNERNAKIAKRFNDDQPFDQAKLNADAQKWRANFSSGFLSTTIKRAQPAYKKIIDEAKLLTSSELDDSTSDSKERAEIFRTNITRAIRRWDEWNDFVSQVAQENLLYGYAAAVRTDEIDWKPIFARQDEVFFPDGVAQSPDKIPYFCYRHKFQIHELAEYLKDPEAAERAGWNLNNIEKLLNEYVEPENRRDATNENARNYEDVIRESTIGSVYSKEGIKVIDALMLYIKESTGKVSHWIVSEKSGEEMCVQLERFDKMSDCLALFSIEVGNGKLHGSKGAGRLLYNRALAIERARNIALDNYYLASLVILRTTGEGKRALSMDVAHPFMVLSSNVEVVPQSFSVNEEAFRSLDNFSVQLAEQQIGSYTPSTALMNSTGDETAAKVNYVASVEQQIRDGVIGRWWNQMQRCVFMMQKAMCSPDNIMRAFQLHRALTASTAVKLTTKLFEFMRKIGRLVTGKSPVLVDNSIRYDNEAIECLLRVLKAGLTPEQIYELGQCPPQQTVEDMTAKNATIIDVLSGKYMNDPLADKLAVRRDDVASKLGYSAAERWFPAEIDESVVAEQTRQQLEEWYLLLHGEDVPVSSRDNDVVHLGVLIQKAGMVMQMLQGAASASLSEDDLKLIDNALKHGEKHLQSALSKGFKESDLTKEIQFITTARNLMASVGFGQNPQLQGGQELSGPSALNSPTMPPVVPGVNRAGMLPPMQMSPVEAAQTKPLSQSPVDLSPPVA